MPRVTLVLLLLSIPACSSPSSSDTDSGCTEYVDDAGITFDPCHPKLTKDEAQEAGQ